MAKKDPTDFTSYIGTCFERWILPVLPYAARLEVRENGTTIDPANCGKIPGKYLELIDGQQYKMTLPADQLSGGGRGRPYMPNRGGRRRRGALAHVAPERPADNADYHLGERLQVRMASRELTSGAKREDARVLRAG